MFENISHNRQAAAVLRRYAESGEPNHAFILNGRSENDKDELTASFAKALLCEGDKTAACRCIPCVTYNSGNHPDVFNVAPTKTKSIGVDDVRGQIVAPLEIKPYRSDYKIFIIRQAQLMTPAAQNALLKTLEEPPTYGIFLLLTDNADLLLPTVQSRCVKLNLDNPPIKRVIAEQGFLTLRGGLLPIIEQAEQASDGDIDALFVLAAKLGEYKADIHQVLDIMYLTYRDIAAYIETSGKMILQNDIRDFLVRLAADKGAAEFVRKADAVGNAGYRLRRNANFQLTLEIMMLDIAGIN
jgi:DNA polymerase-3 subunit delta'